MEMAFWCESNISFFFIKKSFDPSLCDVGKPNKNVCTWSEVTEPIWEQWYTKTKKSKRKKKRNFEEKGEKQTKKTTQQKQNHKNDKQKKKGKKKDWRKKITNKRLGVRFWSLPD